MTNLRSLMAKFFLLLSIGFIFVAISEFWFYQLPSDSGYTEVLLAYGIIGYAFLILLSHYQVWNFKGFFLAAAVFGFLVEGVPVPTLFTILPFTIVWTSLAWHALISVAIFWYYFRIIMTKTVWWRKISFMVALGLFLGAWNTYMWNIVETTGGGATVQKFPTEWFSTTIFADQFLTGFALFLLGHIIFQFAYPKALPILHREKIIVAVIITFFFVAGSLLNMFPFSLTLIPLLLICHLALKKHQQSNDLVNTKTNHITETFSYLKLSWLDYLYTLLIPIVAIGTYDLMYTYKIEIEMNVLLILTAGPVSVILFLKALWTKSSKESKI
ncbi:hypothetical protein H6784_05500 [Candidatus Nomurabacteria bacterium]|nr:hypothetical protein [Candidatus Nomurabacteria bacterium]